MARHMPPLPALRSFEAAARRMSFKLAAEELFVTPSAVSHAVQGLEDYLGIQLFHRQGRKLVLTDGARAYLPALRDAFDRIENASQVVMAEGEAEVLTLATAPSFGRTWLLPRLQSFLDANPGIDLRILATMHPLDHLHGEADLSVLYGAGDWPEVEAELIIRETVVPVCSPGLLEGEHPLARPEDLRHHRLLHSELRLVTWPMWLEAAGVSGVNSIRGMRFNRATYALDAALHGLGVALEGRVAASAYLSDERLVVPFGATVTSGRKDEGYYLGRLAGHPLPGKARAFVDWLMKEAEPED